MPNVLNGKHCFRQKSLGGIKEFNYGKRPKWQKSQMDNISEGKILLEQ